MSDGLPTEEQLRRMERTVMTRIRRRAELPRRIATGATVAALVVGGVFIVPRLGLSSGGGSGSSSGSGGSTAEYDTGASTASGGGSSALVAACHGSSSATSPVRRVPVSADTAKAAVQACLLAYEKGLVPGGLATPTTASGKDRLTVQDLVACRDADGRLQVLLADAHPSTLCKREGLTLP